MTQSATSERPLSASTAPIWLPLLQKPYENMLGGKTAWDLRAADGTPVHIERGGQGLNNAVYRVRVAGEQFGCKLFVTDERRRAAREWAALSTLHAAGLKMAPRPVTLAADGPLPQPVIVYHWVDGTPFSTPTPTAGDLIALVQTLQQVHYAPRAAGHALLPAWHQPASYADYLAEIIAAHEKIAAWAKAISGAGKAPKDALPSWLLGLAELLPLMEQAAQGAAAVVGRAASDGCYPLPALVRVDGNLDNVLRTADGLMLIDWEYSGLGDPAYDLAELRWSPRALAAPAAAWETALATYQPSAADAGFAERLAVYNRLVPAWWVGRSVLHLLEGAGQMGGRKRLAPVPARFYKSVRKQLDRYLAALGLMAPPEGDEREE
jgi:aminoglycoside phosphotransferase (APT) family kinase protein